MITKIITITLLLIATCIGGWYGFTRYSKVNNLQNKMEFVGILDSNRASWDNPRFNYLHEFIAWSSDVDKSLEIPLGHLAQSKKQLMITVEPWPNEGQDGVGLHKAIIAGEYDSRMTELCTKIVTASPKAIIRWGHEMDLAGNTRYPWAIKDYALFSESFAKMYSVCKKVAPSVYFMWSPAGIESSVRYYPGGQYVDLIGLSIFGYPAYEQKNYKRNFTIDDVFSSRYRTVSGYGKPIVIAELSVAGEPEYKKQWLDYAFKQFVSPVAYPLLKGFAYFDAGDVEAWEPGITAPNFDIPTNDLENALAKYKIGDKQ